MSFHHCACPDINQSDLLPLTSVFVGSNAAHDNMWDSQRPGPDINQSVEGIQKPGINL